MSDFMSQSYHDVMEVYKHPPSNEISPFLAILWVFYPIGILVFIGLLFSDDDDDDEGGGVMTPAGVYQGA